MVISKRLYRDTDGRYEPQNAGHSSASAFVGVSRMVARPCDSWIGGRRGHLGAPKLRRVAGRHLRERNDTCVGKRWPVIADDKCGARVLAAHDIGAGAIIAVVDHNYGDAVEATKHANPRWDQDTVGKAQTVAACDPQIGRLRGVKTVTISLVLGLDRADDSAWDRDTQSDRLRSANPHSVHASTGAQAL